MEDRRENDLLKNLIDGVFFVDLDRKITFWNRGAERISGYTSQETVGLRCDNQILEHVNFEGKRMCSEGCPLLATMADGTAHEENVYLHHKKGHRVPVTIRTMPIKDEKGKMAGCIETFVESSSQSQLLQELWQANEIGLTDPLCVIGNQHFCEISLSSRIFEFEGFHVGFGVLLLDVDLFKYINDMYGEKIGDDILIMVAKTLTGVLRKLDIVTRWEKDEFVIILPNVPEEALAKVAERLRVLVKNSFLIVGDAKVAVSVSIGATTVKPGDTPEAIIQRAHTLTQASKILGRDRVTTG